MQKMMVIREEKEKEFTTFINRFNRILKNNNQKTILAVQCGETKIDCVCNSFHYKTNGHNYSVNIPDELLKMNDYIHIGSYFKVDDTWMKFTTQNANDMDKIFVDEVNFRCDHCGKNIKSRKAYYFFRKENSLEYKVLGKGCANAYFGYDCETVFEKLAKLEIFERPYYGKSNSDFMSFDWNFVYAMTDYFTKNFKFWEKEVTVNTIKGFLNSEFNIGDENDKIYHQIKDMKNKVNDANWKPIVQDYWNKRNQNNDMVFNIRKGLNKEYVSFRWIGTISYAIYKAVYEHRKITNVNTMKSVNSDFVGNIGDKMMTALTPIKISSFVVFNQFKRCDETRAIVKFADDNGNEYNAFVGYSMIDELTNAVNQQTKMMFSFRIKEHRTFNNHKINEIFYLKKI